MGPITICWFRVSIEGARRLCFNKRSTWFLCTFKFGVHLSNTIISESMLLFPLSYSPGKSQTTWNPTVRHSRAVLHDWTNRTPWWVVVFGIHELFMLPSYYIFLAQWSSNLPHAYFTRFLVSTNLQHNPSTPVPHCQPMILFPLSMIRKWKQSEFP